MGLERSLPLYLKKVQASLEPNKKGTPMPEHSITLTLPDAVYRQAQRVAKTTQQAIEEVVLTWIHPAPEEELVGLEALSSDELRAVTQTTVSPVRIRRLQDLLTAQRQRNLTEDEQQEAAKLVEQEDLLTLRKSKALLLLKQRDALPKNFYASGAC